MPRASAADAALTARQVLEAAIGLFSAHGYADVSLDDIARAAGVTRGAVYHHYGSKVGLFGAVASELQSSVAALVVDAADKAGSGAAEQLRAGSHAFLDAITTGAAVRVLLIDAPAAIGWDAWRRLDAENSAAHLREALQDVGVADDHLDATTMLLSGAMNEAALWIAQHDDLATARDRAHGVLDRLITALIP
ncbi:TetR/AcrR family transcriptional regulator [Microbacterium aerolatum]|uniref:TetR family transcriptional regulator n=1 Tax=Microbacterium aerolatum TaxID=153731 RepID=A0A511AKX8_9MICO|nr:TetR family transcriptional regulator [Microbacterium aerolatum]MCK3770449.1 TetR/AcrR family transcriptional regulator [Microbacterium aerolatum]GEK87491.1 TetR family transcriptional regulator [Microbacterium aerolatum]GGB23833.1 TetR family transcriptional regulator [Microbacterium aerolatum]